jgi:hypothetical protein
MVLYFHCGSLTYIPEFCVKFKGSVQNDKRDVFNFPIVTIPFKCSNIPTVSSYGVYISRHNLECWLCKTISAKFDLFYPSDYKKIKIVNAGRCTQSDGKRLVQNDKRDVFNFPIVTIPFICSNIPTVSSYGVYISQFIWYSRACGRHHDLVNCYVVSV